MGADSFADSFVFIQSLLFSPHTLVSVVISRPITQILILAYFPICSHTKLKHTSNLIYLYTNIFIFTDIINNYSKWKKYKTSYSVFIVINNF